MREEQRFGAAVRAAGEDSEGAAVLGGEPHHVTSSTRRMAGLAAPSSLNKFLGKAVPRRRRFQ